MRCQVGMGVRGRKRKRGNSKDNAGPDESKLKPLEDSDLITFVSEDGSEFKVCLHLTD